MPGISTIERVGCRTNSGLEAVMNMDTTTSLATSPSDAHKCSCVDTRTARATHAHVSYTAQSRCSDTATHGEGADVDELDLGGLAGAVGHLDDAALRGERVPRVHEARGVVARLRGAREGRTRIGHIGGEIEQREGRRAVRSRKHAPIRRLKQQRVNPTACVCGGACACACAMCVRCVGYALIWTVGASLAAEAPYSCATFAAGNARS